MDSKLKKFMAVVAVIVFAILLVIIVKVLWWAFVVMTTKLGIWWGGSIYITYISIVSKYALFPHRAYGYSGFDHRGIPLAIFWLIPMAGFCVAITS